MAKALVRDIQAGDVDHVLAHMRAPDRLECDALFGAGHEETMLRKSVDVSVLSWTLCFDDIPAAVFGVASSGALISDIGIPWLIGTDAIDKNRGAFIKLNRIYIPKMLELYPRLVNAVDCRNVKSVAYLKRMGFTFIDPVVMGAQGQPFYPFFMDRIGAANVH